MARITRLDRSRRRPDRQWLSGLGTMMALTFIVTLGALNMPAQSVGGEASGHAGPPGPLPVMAPVPGPLAGDIRHFSLCHTGGGYDCVVDGDTFWFGGEKIRIADIDTPETHPPRCEREGELGTRATDRLHALLNSGVITLRPAPDGRSHDRYGRRLAIVMRDGQNVGSILVSEGLARGYAGGPRQPWC